MQYVRHPSPIHFHVRKKYIYVFCFFVLDGCYQCSWQMQSVSHPSPIGSHVKKKNCMCLKDIGDCIELV